MVEPAQTNQLLHWDPEASYSELSLVDPLAHRTGLRKLASGVTIVATCLEGERIGLTATAVCSVTIDPPRLVIFINKSSRTASALMRSGALCVNLLGSRHKELALIFAGMNPDVPVERRFDNGDWTQLFTGSPALSDALQNFDCRIVRVYEESTHFAFACDVVATREAATGEPLIWFDGAFRELR